MQFNDDNIELIFGADDAENENEERFKQYFYFNRSYDSITSSRPIRILVGHKGVGKSALLKRAFLADRERDYRSVWLRSDGLNRVRRGVSPSLDFQSRVEDWKSGLVELIIEDVIYDIYGPKAEEIFSDISGKSLRSKTVFLKELISRVTNGQDSITVYIDDIDRGWEARTEDIKNISAVLNAIRDVVGADNFFRFRIGLRSDVYFLVRTSDESTDKIERNVVWLRWTNNEILQLAAMRIATFFDMSVDQESLKNYRQIDITNNILSRVIDPVFTAGRGHWSRRPVHNVLLSLTRARPRDLVKLFHGAAQQARLHKNGIISSENLESAFPLYSQERLQDVINEFKTEMPNIRQFVLNMKPTRRQLKAADNFKFSTDQLGSKISGVLQHVRPIFTNGQTATPRALIEFLYKIDFITARLEKEGGEIERHYFDEARFLAAIEVEFGYKWEIHPAYRWALQPQNVDDVFVSLADM